MTLTPPIGAVAVGAQQQGYVIMLGAVADTELNGNLRKECRDCGRIKPQAIKARHQGVILGQEIANTSVRVGLSLSQFGPGLLAFGEKLQSDTDAGGRPSGGRVENVRGDGTHSVSSFRNRKRVISRCCSAAFWISRAGSLASRSLRIASISEAVFPE